MLISSESPPQPSAEGSQAKSQDANHNARYERGQTGVPAGRVSQAEARIAGLDLVPPKTPSGLNPGNRGGLIHNFGIHPKIVAQSGAFSLEPGAAGDHVRQKCGFIGSKALIGKGIVFTDYDLEEKVLGYSVLRDSSRFDPQGYPVFCESSNTPLPYIGVDRSAPHFMGGMSTPWFWGSSRVHALMAASYGWPAFRVVEGEATNAEVKRAHLQTVLQAMFEAWDGQDHGGPHLFVHHDKAPRDPHFEALTLIAEIMRERAEVIEVHLCHLDWEGQPRWGVNGSARQILQVERLHRLLSQLTS